MPAFFGLGTDNPIVWCNFYRKGGFKTLAWTGTAYFAILAALVVLSAGLSVHDASRSYSAWMYGFLGLQFLFMVVIGAGRVSATIRGDQTSGMAESLRMMPLPARHAVAGNLSSTFYMLAGFFVANFSLGLIVTSLSQLPVQHWLAANAVLLAFAVFVWTVSAFTAFLIKTAGAMIAIVSLAGVFGNAGLLKVAPGIVVLAGPLIGGTIFVPRSSAMDLVWPLWVSFASQFLIGSIFFAGATRKYRRPDALALGPRLSVGLLVGVVGISLLAILHANEFQPAFIAREFGRTDPAVPFCGSSILAMLVALIPLANLARLHTAWRRGRADDPELRREAPPMLLSSIIVTVILSLMIFALPRPPGGVALACTVAAFFGFSMSVMLVAAWFYRTVDTARIILTIWLCCYCLVPLAADFARHQLSEQDEPTLSSVATFSPVGLLIEVSTQQQVDVRPAGVFHILIPLLPLRLYLRRRERKVIPKPITP